MQSWNEGASRFSLEGVKGVAEFLGGALALLVGLLSGAAVIAFFVAPMLFLRGWALTLLWSWFVAPTFELPQLSLAVAIGLVIVIDLLTPSIRSYTRDATRATRKRDSLSWEERKQLKVAFFYGMAAAYSMPLIFLLTGYIVHQFV